MKAIAPVVLIALTTAVLPGQQAPPVTPLSTFASSADVQALIAKAKGERKDGQAIVTEKILQFAPYSATLEYRASVGNAAVHDKEAEMMYVIEGSGKLITGGKITGTTIQGGDSRTVSKGDFLVVPEGTPHWFSAIDGSLVLMTIKMPRSTP